MSPQQEHKELMASAQFKKQAEKRVRALEACGRPFWRSSRERISVAQFESPAARDALFDLSDLLNQLQLSGEGPLSLAQAQSLFNSCILDALCSVLTRLQWRQFGTDLDALANVNRGFIAAGRALDCVVQLLGACERVMSSEAETAWRETHSR